MPDADAFSTLAEIGVAFLGFTGVVGVFAERRHPPAVAMRLWVMVEFGLALLLLSLLPLVLHSLGWAGPTLWATCSIATALFLLGHLILVVPRIVPHMRSGAWGEVPLSLNLSIPVAYGACFATQVLNALGIGPDRTHGGFVLGLFLLVAASGLNFVALLMALRSARLERDA